MAKHQDVISGRQGTARAVCTGNTALHGHGTSICIASVLSELIQGYFSVGGSIAGYIGGQDKVFYVTHRVPVPSMRQCCVYYTRAAPMYVQLYIAPSGCRSNCTAHFLAPFNAKE